MQRAVFLDRDNTLIANDGDLGDAAAVELLPGVPAGLAALDGAGFALVVVTNQGGVARGRFGEDAVRAVHRRIAELVDRFASRADVIDAFYFCPYHPEALLAEYRREHPWRKPGSGMLEQAAHDLDIDLRASWLVGDAPRDIEAGRRAGCRTVAVGSAMDAETNQSPADFRAADFADATRIILAHADTEPGRRPRSATPRP